MIQEPRGGGGGGAGGRGSGQSTRLLSPSEKIAHGGNRTRDSLSLAPWPLAEELPLVMVMSVREYWCHAVPVAV